MFAKVINTTFFGIIQSSYVFTNYLEKKQQMDLQTKRDL